MGKDMLVPEAYVEQPDDDVGVLLWWKASRLLEQLPEVEAKVWELKTELAKYEKICAGLLLVERAVKGK